MTITTREASGFMGRLHDGVIAYLLSQDTQPRYDGDDMVSFAVDVLPTPWRVHVWVRERAEQVVVHSVYPSGVPAERRDAMAIFLTRANYGLPMGNFEMDFADGEVRFKTSVDVGQEPLSLALARPLFMANITTFSLYLPGITAVIEGEDPTAAIAAIDD
jgi:hypothetical protein